MTRKNFYILLELSIDPPENDLLKINEAIEKKQKEWSALRNHSSKGREAQQNLGFINNTRGDINDNINEVMNNPSLRQRELDEAKKIVLEEQKAKFIEIDNLIELISSKGTITEKEIENLAKKFSSIPESDIRKRIKIPIVKDEAQKIKRNPLDSTIAKKISESLKIIEKVSLYDLLELSPTSSLKALQDNTKEKYSEFLKKSTKNAEMTASQELLGLCKSIFKTEADRNSYDDTLILSRFITLAQEIDDVTKVNKMVNPELYDKLLKKAMSFGFIKEEAQECINQHCQKSNIAVQIPYKFSVDEMKQCGRCGTMNISEAKSCDSCAYSLEIECPNLKCKKQNRSSSKVCIQCGFIIGDMPNAIDLIKHGKLALSDNDLDNAYSLLKKADIYWPNNPEIIKNIDIIETKRKNIQEIINELTSSISQKLFYKARGLINKLRFVDSKNLLLSNEESINRKIENAEQLVKKAKSSSNNDLAIDFYSDAINECKDCQDAIDGMSKSSPEPPNEIKVKASSRGISINWSTSPSKGIVNYKVIRNITPPISPNDGETLVETTQNVFEDFKSEPGVIYYYSVYSVRSEINSSKGTLSKAIFRISDVENLEIKPADSAINISWKATFKFKEIIVIRKEGAIPSNEHDGIRLSGIRINGVTDSGLKNGAVYGYLIITIFTEENGKPVKSYGITCQSTPLEPPKPITNMVLSKKANYIEIIWTPPSKGSVQLFYSETPFSIAEGSIVSTSRLSEFGTPIAIQNIGKTHYTVNFQGTIYMLPVTVDGDLAVLGLVKSVTSLDEISNIKSSINSGSLYLEWLWPLGSKKVLICYNNISFPVKPAETISTSIIQTKEQYDKNSSYVLHSLEDKNYFFTIFVASDKGENTIYSSGITHLVDNSPLYEIFYEVSIKKTFLRKLESAKLILKTSSKNVTLPELVLVKKIGDIPIRKSDGNIIQRIPPGLMLSNSSSFEIEIPFSQLSKGSFIKLFTYEDRQAAKFRLLSASKDKLSLG